MRAIREQDFRTIPVPSGGAAVEVTWYLPTVEFAELLDAHPEATVETVPAEQSWRYGTMRPFRTFRLRIDQADVLVLEAHGMVKPVVKARAA